MAYSPPRGIPPTHLEGKRTGRPRGSKNFAPAWRDAVWGFEHAFDDEKPPSDGAGLWRLFANFCPEAVEEWLVENGQISA
jgi:hypothetical protein